MDNKKTGTPAVGSPLNKIAHGAPLKHAQDAWGFKHGHKYHRATLKDQSTPAPGHGKGSNMQKDEKSPAKHLNHGPFSNADHSIGDHAKNFIADPMGTTKKVVKQTANTIKRKGKNVVRNIAYGATYGPIFDAFGYDHPFGGKSNPSVKSEKYGGKKKEKTKTRGKKKETKKEKPTGREGWKTY